MNSFTKKESILPILLVFPMVSQWILPESIEQKLFIDILGITFYIPNICYLLYLIKYNKSLKTFRIPNYVTLSIFIFMSYFFVNLLLNIGENKLVDVINIFVNDFTFVYAFILYFYFPLPPKLLDKAKYILMVALVFLCLEIILFSMGILTYTSSAGNDLMDGKYETGGIFRVSTTIGAATGTAVIVSILGILCTSYFKFESRFNYFLIGLTTVSVFFTISRGSIAVWSIYLIAYLYLNHLKGKGLKHQIACLSVFAAISIFAVYKGILDPLIERQQRLVDSGEVDSGRNFRNEKMREMISDSKGLGIGAGMFYPDKSINGKYKLNKKYDFSPHNSYLLILLELGVLGLLFFLILYWYILKKLNFRKAHSIACIPIFIFSFGTENFSLYQECFPLITFLLLSSFKYNINKKDDTVYMYA